jgi:titin
LEDRTLLAVFTVINTNDSGLGSLRQAILDANANPGLDMINFDLPQTGVQTISPLSALPLITSPVIINGYSQPGTSPNTMQNGDNAVLLIELSGSNAGMADGLSIQSGAAGSTIEGLVINGWNGPFGTGGNGILLSTNNNTSAGNFTGTDPTGTVARANANDGIAVLNGASNNTIGGTTVGARNIISGNGSNGIEVNGAPGNLVEGNLIGTSATGAGGLGNGLGIELFYGATNNTIGGTVAGEGNVISGNLGDGIDIWDSGNLVQGNLIGTDAIGTATVANFSGVSITSDNNTIGGTAAGAGNVVSGNHSFGIGVSGSSNLVAGNLIGTDITGTAALGNTGSGVELGVNGANNTIGGSVAGARNVISGNQAVGINLRFSLGGDLVEGNFIGTDATGTHAMGNNISGISIGTFNCTIGGTVAGAANVISGNPDGIMILNSGNLVQGNMIGTDATGMAALGNQTVGVLMGSVNCTLGGRSAGAGNLISGNRTIGVRVTGSGNMVQGNFVGTDATGAAPLGNLGSGISFEGAFNTLGGTAAGAGNVISGNQGDGVDLMGSQSNNLVQGNMIGTDMTGTRAVGNRGNGIFLPPGTASGNSIGGLAGGGDNMINFNAGDGVSVNTGAGSVTILGTNNSSQRTSVITGMVRLGISNALSSTTPVFVAAGATLDLNGLNDSIGSLSGGGSVTLGSAVLTLGDDNTSTSFTGVLSGNGGLIKMGAGTLSLMGSSTYQGATLVAQGVLQLMADDTLPVTSTVTLMAGATLDFKSGQNDFLTGSSISGTGSVSFSGGTTNLSGTYDLTGSATGTQAIGGTINFQSPVTSLGDTLSVSDGRVNFSGGAPIAVANVMLGGGMLGGSDTVVVGSQMSWTGGTMNDSGSTDIADGALLLLNGDAPKASAGHRMLTIRPGAHIVWMGLGGIVLSGVTMIKNEGNFDTEDGNHVSLDSAQGGAPQILNNGTFNSNGQVQVDSGVTFTNSGSVEILSGRLNLGDDYTQTGGSTLLTSGAVLAVGGTVRILAGSLAVFGMVNGPVMNAGLLYGSGTVNGDVTNAGQVDPGDTNTTGILTINGNYTQTADGTLTIRIGGMAAGTGYDQLVIGGTAMLDGTLTVSLIGYTPKSGDTFQILLFSASSTTFATVNVDLTIFNVPSYDPQDVTLQAI